MNLTDSFTLPYMVSKTHRKKRLLALFVGLATIGLIIGLIVAFKPEGGKGVAPAPAVSGRSRLNLTWGGGRSWSQKPTTK